MRFLLNIGYWLPDGETRFFKLRIVYNLEHIYLRYICSEIGIGFKGFISVFFPYSHLVYSPHS